MRPRSCLVSSSFLLCSTLLLSTTVARAQDSAGAPVVSAAPPSDSPEGPVASAPSAEQPEQPAPSPAAQEPAPVSAAPAPAALSRARPNIDTFVTAYGELLFGYHNYGLNQNRTGGAQRDSRLEFDTTRFVLEMKGALPDYGLEVEVEVEFEHGGTGTAMELEYEEFGEFDQELDKGGEILVEELYISKKLGDHAALAVGRFYVAVGTLSEFSRPTDYLGTLRDEAETGIIPNTWDEMGLRLRYKFPWGLRLTGQLVNGLDSTGFSSQLWAVGGHQRRFEVQRATDMALVFRADVTRFDGFIFGVSAYHGDTTRNRPKADLVKSCEEANDREVAPCGYVSAPLTLLDVHLSVSKGPWSAKGMVMYGHLKNAELVSQRNARLSNLLGVMRTPVSDNALAAWGELGYDIASVVGLSNSHHLVPFVRYDYVDTQFKPRAELYDNPRFRRTVYTVGVAYNLLNTVYAKLDFGHRRMGSNAFRPENTLRLATGFNY
nr:OprO/OprP family phosphate-selective porin [Myxococcus sp. MH1]